MRRAALLAALTVSLVGCTALKPPPDGTALGGYLRSRWTVQEVTPGTIGSFVGLAEATPEGCHVRIANGYTPGTEDRQVLLLHEFAHCADMYRLNYTHANLRVPDIRGLLGRYAETNAAEAYAEAFAATYLLTCGTRQFVTYAHDTPPCPLPEPDEITGPRLRALLKGHALPFDIYRSPLTPPQETP